MKYEVTAFINDKEYTKTVNVRSNAKNETLFVKCAKSILEDLLAAKEIIGHVTINWDLPNVWRNGAIGALWIEKPFVNITIIREDGMCIAL